jgi:hypothetical protein
MKPLPCANAPRRILPRVDHAEQKVPDAWWKERGTKAQRGRTRCQLARWKHGFSLKAAVAERRRIRALIAECGKLMKALGTAGAARTKSLVQLSAVQHV